MIIKALAVIVLATFASTFPLKPSTLPLKPEYDDVMSPKVSGVPMARNDSDSNEDDRVKDYLEDIFEVEIENETLSLQWTENDDNSSSSFFPDPTTTDDVDSNEDDHLQKFITNPPTDENEDVSSSSLRPENDSLQESFTNSQKNENEDLTSSTPMPENDGYKKPKHIPDFTDFTREQLQQMLEAKLNEDGRILDANKRKLENDHPQESLENPQKDEDEEVTSSSPWPENDGMASRTVDDPKAVEYYDDEYEDDEEFEQLPQLGQLEQLEIKEFEKEILDKTLANSQEDKTWMEQNLGTVAFLGIVAALVALFVLGCLCDKCLDCKKGEGKSDNDPDSIDIEAQDQDQNKIDINHVQDTIKSAKDELQDQIESIENNTELPKEQKIAVIEKLKGTVIHFNEIEETTVQRLLASEKSAKNLKNTNNSGYGRQSMNNVSIGNVALKLAAESPRDNNDKAVGPTANSGSLPRGYAHGGCAKILSKRHSTTSSGLGESIQTISASVDSQNRQLSTPHPSDQVDPVDEDSAIYFERGGLRGSKSHSDITKADANQSLSLVKYSVIRRENLRKRESRPRSIHIQNSMLTIAEVHGSSPGSSPEVPKKQLATTSSQKDENEDLTSSTSKPKNDGYMEPKHTPIPTPEEVEKMVAKLNEYRRILAEVHGSSAGSSPGSSPEVPNKQLACTSSNDQMTV